LSWTFAPVIVTLSPVFVHADGDEPGDVHDATVVAALEEERVEPQVLPSPVEAPLSEAAHGAVQLLAEQRDLAL
jgi:hypothetical protein